MSIACSMASSARPMEHRPMSDKRAGNAAKKTAGTKKRESAERRDIDVDLAGKLAALDRSQAVIEFNLDGTVVTANQNFLGVLGYSLDEIKGRHHSIFVDPQHRESLEYRQF